MRLVSIIMPAYNCEKYISQAIDSILNQTYTNFELLISDDCSTDTTKQIIDSYKDSRIKTFHNQVNLGYLKASNKLFTLCKGDYITFQDADDTSELNRLEILLHEFRININVSCVGSFVNRINIEGDIIDTLSFKTSYNDIKKDLPYFFNCVGSALMVKKEVVSTIGFYNEYFDRIGSEDLYWFGLVATNFNVANIPYGLYNYRINPNSVSREKLPIPKKQMSGEFATVFLKYYYKKRSEIFNDSYNLKIVELYLLGKCNCWRGNTKDGIKMLLKSIIYNPFIFTERYSLLKIYLPKIFTNG